MEVMRAILLILFVLVVLVFGYFLMAGLDKLLDENRRAIEKENEKKEPSCVMLTEDMSDEDIAEEVRIFRENHKSIRIVLYDCADTDLSESLEYHARQKQ